MVARPYLFWFAAPVVLVVGMLAGIHSTRVEEADRLPPPRAGGEAAAVRQQPYVIAGQIKLIDLRTRSIVVQRRDGRMLDVFLKTNTAVKLNGKRVRPQELNSGDRVMIVGKPHPRGGLDAMLITIMRPKDVGSPPK